MNRTKLLRSLRDLKNQSRRYDSGRVFSSMCSEPLNIAVRAYREFLETNLLDGEIFPNVKTLEGEAIKIIARMFSSSKASGYITSGGTEGNIFALWVARKLSGRKTVVAPTSAHYSIDKACDLQQVGLVRSRLGEDYRASADDIQEKVGRDTIAIVATAGTTALGLVDPIEKIAEIAKDNKCFLHVDASFGGFVLPFLENPPRWDFSVEGVTSIVADPHKMGLAPIPAGSVLFRNGHWLRSMEIEVPYLSKTSPTLLGTRPGASAAAVWTAINLLGREGYRKIVKRCMSLTGKLANGIKKVDGLDLIAEPELNIVAFEPNTVDLHKLKAVLEVRGWLVSMNKQPKSIRLVVMPHHRSEHISSFLVDLKECLEGLA